MFIRLATVKAKKFLNICPIRHLLVSECLDVVEETSSSGLSLTGRLPQEAGGVDDVTEENGRRDVAEQTEDDELNAESESLLLFVHGSVKIDAIVLTNNCTYTMSSRS